MITCRQCGHENPQGSRFCSNCGAALAGRAAEVREERKIVSVLFADLVGFTSKAERLDPEDVRATLSPYYASLRGELERFGGSVEKFIGDAVVAVFGAPIAHEDDPERAVRAALAIRDSIVDDGQLQVRIGITTGEALVAIGAPANEGEGIAAGDVVNTAARLQSGAPVNGILVSEATYRATRHAIDYSDHEPVDAKGKAQPVPVWEALQARSHVAVEVMQVGVGLVGRQRELDLLIGALSRAREERTAQLLTLVGVPGIGKSRLVYELSRTVDDDTELIPWRQGRSLPYGEGIAFWALGEMTKAEAGILESDSAEEADRKLQQAVAALVPDDRGRIVEHLRPLVGLAAEIPSGGEVRDQRFAAWRRFLEALAEQGPAVLVFEDLHWADDDLLDFVDHLAEWATGVPLLIVATARPELLERRPGWGGGKPNALTLTVTPLSDEETARLLAELLQRAVLPAETQASLLARAGGNPLYAEQFARLLAETGDAANLPVPENVQGIIAARLDGLPESEKRLLQAASAFGKVFWLGAVCSVEVGDRAEAVDLLHALERKEFIRRERRSSVGGEEEYAFRHLLVRDVAYGQVPRAERAERHERAARWIESLGRPEDHAEMLAQHYLEALALRRAAGRDGDPGLAERARDAARDAGDRALALGAYSRAKRLFEEAIELTPDDDPARADLLLRYGRAGVDDAAFDERMLEQASASLQQAGKLEGAMEAEALLAAVWWLRAERDRAMAHLGHAEELAAQVPASPSKAFVVGELSRYAMLAEDVDRTIALGVQSLAMAEEFGLDETRARNLNTLGMARILGGDPERGLVDMRQAIEISSPARSLQHWQARANLSWVTAQLGDVRRAGELAAESREASQTFGSDGFLRWERGIETYYLYWEGRWDDCLVATTEFVAESESGPAHYLESLARFLRASVRVARADLEAAVADVDPILEHARSAKDPQVLYPALAACAWVLLAAGDRDAANRLAEELLDGWRARGVRHVFESADSAWVFRELGRSDEMLAMLGASTWKTKWHDAARLVLTGDLAAAAGVYGEIGALPEEAYARLLAAEELVSAGRRADADAQLRPALAFFDRVRATAHTRRAEALLPASA